MEWMSRSGLFSLETDDRRSTKIIKWCQQESGSEEHGDVSSGNRQLCDVEFLGKDDVVQNTYTGSWGGQETVEKKSVEDYFIHKPQEAQETPCLTLKQE